MAYYKVIKSYPVLVGIVIVLLSGLVGHFPVVWFLKATKVFRPTPKGKPQFAAGSVSSSGLL